MFQSGIGQLLENLSEADGQPEAGDLLRWFEGAGSYRRIIEGWADDEAKMFVEDQAATRATC